MRRFRKAVAVVLASAMCVSMSACGKSDTDSNTATTESASTESADKDSSDNADTEASSSDAAESVESSLTGTGPATKEDAFAGGDTGSAQLKDGDVLVDITMVEAMNLRMRMDSWWLTSRTVEVLTMLTRLTGTVLRSVRTVSIPTALTFLLILRDRWNIVFR